MKLLIVDFLDSYSHNIPAFLRRASSDSDSLDIDIRPFNTLDKDTVEAVAANYHGIILSAGPGTVDCEQDLGSFTPALLSYRPAIPVYGICLGFQAICRHFGGTIHRLSAPHHGLISDILSPDGNPLGRQATRYHSLEARLDQNACQQLDISALASNDDLHGSSSVMEIKHKKLPFWGVQYHPESIYSQGCEVTVQPFLSAAQSRRLRPDAGITEILAHLNGPELHKSLPREPARTTVVWKSIVCQTDLVDILPELQGRSKDFVLLDSSTKGDWDILAAADTASLFRYSVRKSQMSFTPLKESDGGRDGDCGHINSRVSLAEAWSFLAGQSNQKEYVDGPPDVPFWGGFIGYFGYELGLAELGLDAYRPCQNRIPEYGDIQLLWSTETLVYNKSSKTLYAISLNANLSWIENCLRHAESIRKTPQETVAIPWTQQFRVDHPAGLSYIKGIEAAQEEIKAGNSYEICLTAPSTTRKVTTTAAGTSSALSEDEPSSTERFRSLRKITPAAFMSLINLGGVEMLSASPEEFLSYDAQTAIARMKPIKGTLPKKNAAGEPITLDQADKLLHEPKVIAENLMIVDLVRHDLSQVSRKVTCPDLMHVEDIGPMYQLISTVQAEVDNQHTAWDLIRHSLPPGSMTGAPKRRSCEILQRLEQDYRGLYSGITGYIDVRGSCRTSVNIRNMVKYPGEAHWRIGAGGAITSLSDPVDEWHERQLKAASVCRSLVPQFSVLETLLWEPRSGKLSYWDEHFRRLSKTLKHFGFDLPSRPKENSEAKVPEAVMDCTMQNVVKSGKEQAGTTNKLSTKNRLITVTVETITEDHAPGGDEADARASKYLHEWVSREIKASIHSTQQCRVSLTVDIAGTPSLAILPIPDTPGSECVSIRLDPCATSSTSLEPFITHKTTNRAHYTSARERAGVQGRDEVLMFRSDCQQPEGNDRLGKDTDWLTEGSYTNVAVWNAGDGKWYTPSRGCLPGIMREKLLESGEIVVGDVQRRAITAGTTVKLFNSVRGVFKGLICE